MLRAAHENKVKRYFFSSSACVYPTFLQKEVDAPSINLKESDAIPADPNEFYGWEKLFTEKLCEAYQNDYGMSIRIARFHNIYGECYTSFDKTRGKAPCLMIASVLKYNGGDFTGIWGDGKQTRSFLYAEDCVDGILALMNSDYDKPINIGSDECVTIQQLADMVFKIAGKKPDRIVYQLDKPQGVRGRNASLELVKQVLGWSPKYTLYEGLEKTYAWAKERQKELINI
jgi:nucleoside-diphosphate-sugar epimerase